MESLGIYRELADCYDRLGQVSMRDRFLILAADAALEAGQAAEAERLRQRLLHGSRHHMLRPYSSFAEAVKAPDVQTYLRDLRTNYPLDVAKQLLESLRGAAGPADAPQPMNLSLDPSPPLPPSPSPPAPAPIPPTAPLVDMSGPPTAQPGKLADEEPWRQRGVPPPHRSARLDTYPVRHEAEPPTTPPRPLAQPVPGRPPLSRPLGGGARPAPAPAPAAQPPTVRPALAVPVTQPVPRLPLARPPGTNPPFAQPLATAPHPVPAAAPAPPAQEREAVGQGAWLNMVLVCVVLTAGLALVAFTLARPFLPPGWLP
jgi:hypothetical protein